jgi:hypothetical protein
MLTRKRFRVHNKRFALRVCLWGGVVSCAIFLAMSRSGEAASPHTGGSKHFVQVVEVQGDVPDETKSLARELLKKELGSRDVFTTDMRGDEPSVATNKGNGIRRFEVSLRFESVTKEVKDPQPGHRGKQLALGVKISIFGAEIPTKKMAFSGDGESMQIVEVDERRLEKEAKALMGEVLADAIRQAVDQAVLKLSLPVNEPLDESRKKRPRGAKSK